MTRFALSFASILALGILLHAPASAAQGTPKASTPPSSGAQAKPAAPAAAPPTFAPFKDNKEKTSYALGMNLGTNFKAQGMDIDSDAMLRGVNDAMSGAKTLMTEEEARAALTQLQSEVRAKMEEKSRMAAITNKKDGDAFLDANKAKDGVVVLPSGLQYKIITQGAGPKPTPLDTVTCNYRGTLIDGTEFDSSYKRGQPASFQVGRVIRGWTEALQLMPTGSKWQLYIPSNLAYGERGSGPIGPNAVLIFDVELISVEPKVMPGQPATPPAKP